MNYATDAHKQADASTPFPRLTEYRYFLRFELRRQQITRWFVTEIDRDNYATWITEAYTATVIEKGETPQ